MKALIFILLAVVFLSCSNSKNQQQSLLTSSSCLLFFKSEYNNKEWSCSGNFINKSTLITAAHCADAFNHSDYKLDAKNTIRAYCEGEKEKIRVFPISFKHYPKYTFNDTTSRHLDFALISLQKSYRIQNQETLLTDKKKLKELIIRNDCYINGYKDTLSVNEIQTKLKTPKHIYYVSSIRKSGIRFQKQFKDHKAILHGGIAEKKLYKTLKESLSLPYPGSGFSGSSLICRDDDLSAYQVGVYVGGFKKSRTWVSLLFNDEIAKWLELEI